MPVLLQRVSASDGPGMCLSLTSLVTGGSFAVRAVDRPFKPAERPRLHLRAKFPPGARVNAYLLTRGTWHLLPLTGSDRVDTGQRLLGRVAGVQDDDQWHAVDFNLGEAFAQLYGGENVEVQRVVFAMKEPDPYLYAGFNCNRFGAVWYLDDFRIGR